MFALLRTKLILCFWVLLLSGCALSNFDILHRFKKEKTIDTKFSASIFLNSNISNKRIFVQIRNLACQQFTEKMANSIYAALGQQGARIAVEPIQAEFLLQVDILQCGVNKVGEVQHMIDQGYAAVVANRDIATATNFNNYTKADNLIFSIIADLQISERTVGIHELAELTHKNAQAVKTWKKYQTRLAVTDKPTRGKAFQAAIPALITEFTQAIARIFTT